MSSVRALSYLPPVKKQKHDFHIFFSSMHNKTIIRFGFCDTRIIEVLVRVIRLSLQSAYNTYFDLDYSGYHTKPHPIIVFIT